MYHLTEKIFFWLLCFLVVAFVLAMMGFYLDLLLTERPIT